MDPHPAAITVGGPTRIVAHRGDPTRHRENTLAGVAAALRLGADLVEVDLRCTADGEVVLLHDETLLRLWGVDLAVATSTSADLDLRVRPAGGAPRLAEALALVGGTGRALLLDVDDPEVADRALTEVWAATTAGLVAADEVVWCGRPPSMTRIRQRDPRARLLLSWDRATTTSRRPPGALPDAELLASLRPESFNCDVALLDPEPGREGTGARVLDWAAGEGLAVSVWTVDDPAVMARLVDLGVAALTTNRPDLLGALLGGPDVR